MVRFYKPIALPSPRDQLDITVAILRNRQTEEYYAYENNDTWNIGLRSHASLVIDAHGKKATTIDRHGRRETHSIHEPINDMARAFSLEHSAHGKVFGQVGFNYSAHISGQAYIPGQWPMLSLMAPCVQVAISRNGVTVTGHDEDEARAVFDLIQTHRTGGNTHPVPDCFMSIDLEAHPDDYKTRVARAVSEINKGRFTKVVPSHIVRLPIRVDMLATLYHGRRANTPARTFALSHAGIEAIGFSPEVSLSVHGHVAFTEALAGTRLLDAVDMKKLTHPLLADPKEVLEHVGAIKGSIARLSRLCSPDSIAVKDFMSVVHRGNVHHLFSHVTGCMLPGKDGWDALAGLNITVPGLADEENLEAIRVFEPRPRELYCGSVLMLDGAEAFEAALALRAIFQDHDRQWLQAGAGVTSLSDPEREFAEVCEKLSSVAPYVVGQTGSS
ncbi:hypothetical protein HIM_04644 [Hirsutella minnesotensis 3608]|uniref:Chorismate-utilising enzyme C-terminal domain-containing protein n=1 Tax=Hirsutella minnesotensis 3608 TaxID=1043627 RepID=A0A0F7ZPN7_9HYPO|nr:hypothetical protein HIM_04644 [Hirsutella minnesotensis 3608]